MKVLIFGEGGNLAMALAPVLRERGHQVLNDSILGKFKTHESQTGSGVMEFDALQVGQFAYSGTIKPDVIINMAGLVSTERCHGNELLALRENYLAAKEVAEVSRLVGARLIHLSSSASYANPGVHIKEDNPVPGRLLTSYSVTKLLGDQEVLKTPALIGPF